MTTQAKKENLTEDLKSLGFDEKYFIYSVNSGVDIRFQIAYYLDGGIHSKTSFMPYNELMAFMLGLRHYESFK